MLKPAHNILVLIAVSNNEDSGEPVHKVRTQMKSNSSSPLDTPVREFKGGFCAYAIRIKIPLVST